VCFIIRLCVFAGSKWGVKRRRDEIVLSIEGVREGGRKADGGGVDGLFFVSIPY
jgi:hypothetical protein